MGPQPSFGSTWTQFFPPAADFTDTDIPDDLEGNVYVVTGASSGMGKTLAKVLYQRHATVYLTCRTEDKAVATEAELRSLVPKSRGELVFLVVDFADLAAVKNAAMELSQQENRLNILFNNAGVMPRPGKSVDQTTQGYELALGVNCVGAFLFTKLLTPLLVATARTEPKSSVRVVWLSSYGLGMFAPEERGIDLYNLDYHIPKDHLERYGLSKCGSWLLAVEYARRHESDGIVSVAINPGNVASDLIRAQSFLLKALGWFIFYPVKDGVNTQLFAAFSPKLKINSFDWKNDWVIPWGRIVPLRPDLPQATKGKDEGGNGNAQEFWAWNEEQVKNYI